MRTKSIAVALGLCAVVLLATMAPAQSKKSAKHHAVRHHVVRHHVVKKKVAATSMSGAETGLAGVKLFDTGTRIISIYGSPDSIEAVSIGGSSAGPGGAAGGPGGRNLPGGGGGAPNTATPGAGGPSLGETHGLNGDFGFGDGVLDSQAKPMGVPGSGAGGNGGPSLPGGKSGGGTGGGGGGAGSPAGGGSGDRVLFTRWVYNRNASKYGFVLDRFNRVIQCEAIGIQSGKARTRRGITFGSTFAQIIKKYGAPDGYEISGDNIVVRYLSKDKCAFRMNRLGENKPDVVTGIVVAAGKR